MKSSILLSRKYCRLKNDPRLPYHSRIFFSTLPATDLPIEQKRSRRPSLLKDFAELSKLRLTSLVAFTTSAGYFAAASSSSYPFDLTTFGAACVGTMLCAGSASAFNQVFEKDRDALMKRTCHRPLPTGRISLPTAITFGSTMGILGTAVLFIGTNPVVVSLGLGNIILYAGAYTFSKRHTG
jgi:heme O synthase-like polyprenyltransferase